MNTTNGIRKKYTLPLRLAIGVLLMGALFKIQHWPLADALLIIGVTAVVVLYAPRYLAMNPRGASGPVTMFARACRPTGYLFRRYAMALRSVLLVRRRADRKSESGSTKSGIGESLERPGSNAYNTVQHPASNPVFVGGLGLVGMGTLFRIEHWPYGGAYARSQGSHHVPTVRVAPAIPHLGTGRDVQDHRTPLP
ncbi:MAG: hypothetical protein IPO17_14750 [Flavobacteriales bacterium]|nr:hypothetical protein [Flavobacteriales bacterium]